MTAFFLHGHRPCVRDKYEVCPSIESILLNIDPSFFFKTSDGLAITANANANDNDDHFLDNLVN